MIWKDLNHTNVLRLIGKADVQGLQTTCLVSPWMKNGTCIDYMRVNRNIRCMPMVRSTLLHMILHLCDVASDNRHSSWAGISTHTPPKGDPR